MARYHTFGADRRDPLLLQHVTWFLGHPETLMGIVTLLGVVLASWGLSIWWRALEGIGGWSVPWRAALRVVGLLSVALIPFGVEVLFIVVAPVSSEIIDSTLRLITSFAASCVALRLAPRFARALTLSAGAAPGWGKVVGAALLLVGGVLGLQILLILAGLPLQTLLFRVLDFVDGELGSWIIELLSFEWVLILQILSFVYACLVLVAMMRLLCQGPDSGPRSGGHAPGAV